MTTVITHETHNAATHTPIPGRVKAVMAQQRRLLKKFEVVSHYLGGICAGMYLPGIDCTFDNPVRALPGRRPLLVTLEVDDNGSLSFSGAISRPRNGRLHYSVIFNYDLTLPYTPKGLGHSLPANNVVLARRANELLARLVAYGRACAADEQQPLDALQFPTPLHNSAGTIHLEDYTPVLGLSVDNPAAAMRDALVKAKFRNPAAKILARRGLDNADTVSQDVLDELMAEFRAEFPGLELSDYAVCDALASHDGHVSPLVYLDLSLDAAVGAAPDAVVAAMRTTLPPKYQWAASYRDLLDAARNPQQPLVLRRLSAVQLFDAGSAVDLPDDYAGDVLCRRDGARPSVLVPTIE